jgi:hypothetical protein
MHGLNASSLSGQFASCSSRPSWRHRQRLLAGAAAPAGWVPAPAGWVPAPAEDADPGALFVTVHGLYWLAANLAVETSLLIAWTCTGSMRPRPGRWRTTRG